MNDRESPFASRPRPAVEWFAFRPRYDETGHCLGCDGVGGCHSTACTGGREILDACCGGRMWWWDKAHPLALYMDVRQAPRGSVDVRPNFEVAPDVLGDFRAMPFADGAFHLVVFDPPHLVRSQPSDSYLRTKYGALPHDTEQDALRRGFAECWRVLAPGGTLVFKWADKLERVEPHFPAAPIVGTRSPRGGQTRWFIFYKPLAEAGSESAVAA